MVYSALLLLSAAAALSAATYLPVYPVATPYVYSDYYESPTPYISYNYPAYSPIPPLTATVDVKNYGGDEVTGKLTMTQLPGGPVLLMGNVTGLSPGAHGMHIHEFGDLSKGCDSLGAHFNPTLTHHGGPADPFRHVGDLGNIMADSNGMAKISESDHLISLTGPHSVVGRGLVIHSGKDDYGRGGDKESLRTGNSGTRVACGVISWAMPRHVGPMTNGNGNAKEPEAESIEP